MAICIVWHRLQWLNDGNDGHKSLVTSCDLQRETSQIRTIESNKVEIKCVLVFWVSSLP